MKVGDAGHGACRDASAGAGGDLSHGPGESGIHGRRSARSPGNRSRPQPPYFATKRRRVVAFRMVFGTPRVAFSNGPPKSGDSLMRPRLSQ